MPRTTNAALTGRILEAARRLWHEKGEKGLTLRAVATAAGTTTPTVYQRFRNRQELVDAIARQIQAEVLRVVETSDSLEHACARYLRYAREHRRDYVLFFGPDFPRRFRKGRSRPAFEWVQRELARRHGGTPEEHESTVYAVTCLLHGCAGLVQYMAPGKLEREIRRSCLEACQELVRRRRKR